MKHAIQRSIIIGACAGAIAVGCASRISGTDGETHFTCAADSECVDLGPHAGCVQGVCEAEARSRSDLLPPDGGAPPSPPPSTPEAGTPPAPEAGAPPPWDQPLPSPVTFNGNVVSSPGFVAPPGPLRVALVWDVDTHLPQGTPDPECVGAARQNRALVQADGPVDAAPGPFSLVVTATPPREAFGPNVQGEGNIAFAGKLIIYVDGDGDGAFNFTTLSGAESPDRVLGTSSPLDTDMNLGHWPHWESFRVVYADRPNGSYGPPFRQGFGISHWVADATESWGDGESLAPSSPVTLVMDDTLRIQTEICEKICFEPFQYDCPERIGDLPPGGDAMCYPATGDSWASYQWNPNQCDGCRCTTALCHYALDPSLPVPEDWPCEASGGGL